ncbi:MAG: hypothetical protein D6737_17370 [Chloroflexi bacterium]|nr:MAG: hypothetical protein D6737_17370 [Chloroflexota bacterium]
MGISSLLGLIGVLGILLFLVGIGLAVVSASQGRTMRSGILLALVGLIGGIIFSVAAEGVIVVEPTQVAVVFRTITGEVEDTPLRSGTHIIIPILEEATLYPIDRQEFTMSGIPSEGARQGDDSVTARTIDGQETLIDITVLYRIDPEHADQVHVNWGSRWEASFVRPTTRGLVRDVVSNFRAEDIFGERRVEVGNRIRELLSERLAGEGLVLTDLIVRDVRFSEEFTRSIEQKQIAEQRALEAAFRVQEEEQNAERVRVEAAGRRDAAIRDAEGEAQAIVLRAQANAEALRVVSEQIAANPSLIQYLYVTQLSDNINLALVPTNSPFLFDFASLAEANPDFVAPPVPDVVVPEASTQDQDSADSNSDNG